VLELCLELSEVLSHPDVWTAVFAQDKLAVLPPDDPETRAKLNDTQLLFRRPPNSFGL
jgi:hypothetical protein